MRGEGGRAVPDPKNFFEPQSGEENCSGLLGGSRGMLPQKILKISVLRSAENAFPTF